MRGSSNTGRSQPVAWGGFDRCFTQSAPVHNYGRQLCLAQQAMPLCINAGHAVQADVRTACFAHSSESSVWGTPPQAAAIAAID